MSRIPKRKILIRQGDTYSHVVSEYGSNGQPADITGSTFLVQLKVDPSDTTPVVQFTTTIINAAQGTWQFTLTPTQTAAIEPGMYVYDVQRNDPDGSVYTRFEGEAEVSQDVSRA